MPKQLPPNVKIQRAKVIVDNEDEKFFENVRCVRLGCVFARRPNGLQRVLQAQKVQDSSAILSLKSGDAVKKF